MYLTVWEHPQNSTPSIDNGYLARRPSDGQGESNIGPVLPKGGRRPKDLYSGVLMRPPCIVRLSAAIAPPGATALLTALVSIVGLVGIGVVAGGAVAVRTVVWPLRWLLGPLSFLCISK